VSGGHGADDATAMADDSTSTTLGLGTRGRGADDAVGHVRRGRGADDAVGHVRGGKGADDSTSTQ
jgi:hypothetical protein